MHKKAMDQTKNQDISFDLEKRGLIYRHNISGLQCNQVLFENPSMHISFTNKTQ